MKQTYKLSWIWFYLLIGSCLGFLLIFLLVSFDNSALVKDNGFYWVVLFFAGMVGLSYGTLSSTITTSPEGIECVSFGIRVKSTWDKVERIHVNPYGFINLFFKEPLYKNEFINSLLRPLAYDRTIQLSPYIDDVASSHLLKDIARYVPNSNIPRFLAENKTRRRTYQRVGVIGLYYFGFLILLIPLAFTLNVAAPYLEMAGFQNTSLVSYLVSSSLIICLMFNSTSLLGYTAETAKLKERKIAPKARALYLSPVVALLLSLVIGVAIGFNFQSRSVLVEENSDFVFLAMLLGFVSRGVSGVVERLVFKDNV